LELIDIDVATTINSAVYTTDLEVDGAISTTGTSGAATNTKITVKFATANIAPSKVTISGTVTADTLHVGDQAAATFAGYAEFTGSGGVTIGTIVVTSGDHANENSTLQFNYAVTSSSGITINDKNTTAFQAYLIFGGNNTATIAADIIAGADDEGTLRITGTGKTFTGSIGSSGTELELIDIDVATTINSAVYTTDLEVDGAISTTGTSCNNNYF
ncbi:MAG: hypothetical protein EBW81_09555, partial [Gammaproteobacteria bacterium]|nr:hypothetical protein [Gammaproteobacteria bacterium]